jgi:hypothetical protein
MFPALKTIELIPGVTKKLFDGVVFDTANAAAYAGDFRIYA